MNKMPFDRPSNSEDELLPEYRFDYKKAKPNRFANRSGKPKLTVVVLDEDVAEVFSTPESVHRALRALIEARPQAICLFHHIKIQPLFGISIKL
jgi:hypothetical protein